MTKLNPMGTHGKLTSLSTYRHRDVKLTEVVEDFCAATVTYQGR